jgi:hypothetical protein
MGTGGLCWANRSVGGQATEFRPVLVANANGNARSTPSDGPAPRPRTTVAQLVTLHVAIPLAFDTGKGMVTSPCDRKCPRSWRDWNA